MKNTKNADIQIINMQNNHGEDTKIEFCCEGNFFEKKGVFYLFYTEMTEVGDTHIRLVAEKDSVKLYRTGASKATMEYKNGYTYSFHYTVPYGDILMTLHTFELEQQLDENGGTIYLRYSLDIQGEIFENDMNITIKTKGTPE